MDQVVDQSANLSAQLWTLTIQLSTRLVTWLATSGIRILLILVLTAVILATFRRVTGRLEKFFVGSDLSSERAKRAETLAVMVRTLASVVVIAFAIAMALGETGLDIKPLLATAGFGGLAVGFGAQNLVKDLVAGFFLLAEDQVRLGDVVQVGARRGVVEGISLRTLRLRDPAGNVHLIPNGSVDVVTNTTKEFSRYLFEVGVPTSTDVEQVFSVLREAGQELQKDAALGHDVLSPLEVLGVQSVSDTSITIQARITTRPRRQLAVGRELNRRVQQSLRERGLALVFLRAV